MSENNVWMAPAGSVLPDFMICGAMKSGTSSLHAILGAHPDIYIPDGELSFFDIDNPFQHSEFNYFHGQRWYSQFIEQDPSRFWQWYSNFFKPAKPGQLVGEDSTTYLASSCAIKRIALQDKAIKLIVMLRQPTDRAYSQYWHMLARGLVGYGFEDVIRFQPEAVLQRSLYADQIAFMRSALPENRVKIILFEDFCAYPEMVLRDVSEFLGVDFCKFPGYVRSTHENRTRIPRFIKLYQMKNRMLRGSSGVSPRRNLPVQFPFDNTAKARITRRFFKFFGRINPLQVAGVPKMHPSTRAFLDGYFRREHKDLDELLGRDVSTSWFGPN